MGRTYRNVALLVLLSAVITVACSPLNTIRSLNASSMPEASSNDAESLAVAQVPTPTAVPGASPTATVVIPPATLIPPPAELYVFIEAPQGPVATPFVTLIAFQALPDPDIEIRGTVDARGFVCSGSPCSVPVPTSSVIIFRAVSSTGATSDEISATVRVELRTDGYYVFLDTVSQFSAFSDSCLRFWRIEDTTDPAWADFVQSPFDLNTDKTLHYLVTRLIVNGVVDVSGCPAGGLSAGMDWPTGCGLERARDAMIAWQNQFDEYIWLASKNYGIPPKVLKTLLEVESQFWPGNERFYVDEIGLGQLNQLGVDVLLRRNPSLYQQVCSLVLDDCAMPYALMPAENQAMIRGAFVNSFSALCPSCQYGLDLDKAKQSVPFIAQVLHANCETVKIVADTIRKSDYIEDMDDPYEDFWRFTLLSYHSGISCFEQAIRNTPGGVSLDWENVEENIECAGGQDYVNGFWGNLLSFDQYLYSPAEAETGQATPVFAATPTPFPTAIPSTAEVAVQVFLDRNQNGVMDETEGLDNITVLLQSVDGTQVSGNTEDGQVILLLAEFPIGSEVTVTLPAYFRSQRIIVPSSGTVPVIFIFTQPTLPTAIP